MGLTDMFSRKIQTGERTHDLIPLTRKSGEGNESMVSQVRWLVTLVRTGRLPIEGAWWSAVKFSLFIWQVIPEEYTSGNAHRIAHLRPVHCMYITLQWKACTCVLHYLCACVCLLSHIRCQRHEGMCFCLFLFTDVTGVCTSSRTVPEHSRCSLNS